MPQQIGMKVTSATLVASMIVLRLLIPISIKDTSDPFITTLELEGESMKSVNSQGTCPVISDNVTDVSGMDMCSESKVEEFEVVSRIKLLNVKNSHIHSEDLGNCSCSSEDDQWNAIEESKLLISYTKEFNGPPKKPFERCNDGSKETVESHNCTTKEGPHNTKNVLSIDVVFLKNNCWSFIYLIVMEMINFIGPMLDIWIGGVASIVLGIEIIPRLFESAFPWFSIPVLMYVTAYSLMVPSLILKCTSRRQWLSEIAVTAAFTCSIFGIIFNVIVSSLPSEYVCVCIGVLMVLAIFCVVHRVFLDAAIQRWMGEFTE